MKKIFLFICIIFSLSLYSQRTGISYQALILDPNGEQLPGYNNENAPLTNTAICLEFIIRDDRNVIEYSEYQSVTTDKYGMVNLIIGTGDYAGGYSGGWDGIVWSEKSKKLIVKLDTSANCSDFVEISNQELTSVAFALYAPGQDGRDGESAYEIWLSEGNVGTVQQFLDSLKGEKGDDGLSAFEIWVDLGNSETEQDFIESLKGADGEAGKSAYQIWLDEGNTGTEQDFLDSLKGPSGTDGTSGNQSLIKTTVEAAGDNCTNGGIKIETGIDTNGDGTLDDDEVNASQTKYLCNGTDGIDGTDGEDGINGSGSGENIPYDVVLIDRGNEYTIPSGYVGAISSALIGPYSVSGDDAKSSFFYGNTDYFDIKINESTYNFGFALAGSQTGYNYLEDYVWLPSGTKISSESYDVQRIVIKLFSSSVYSPKIITQESTVPNGKIWKVSNVLLKKFTNLEKTSFVGTNYAVEIKINDKVHIIGEWGSPSSTTEQMFQSNLKNEIWLPAGTKLSLNRNIIGYSILEYGQGSTGTGSNSSGSSTNSAFSNSLIYTVNGF